MFKVGITGGIGSGKSTLCRLFSQQGIPVYNSDVEAKRLMSSSRELKAQIVEAFGHESYIDTELNRPYLADKVFSDKQSLERLNSIVHPCVKSDFMEWAEMQDAPYVVLECAILFESEFDCCVNRSIGVLSPQSLRIERVISRDGLTREEVLQRIANQLSDDELNFLCDLTVVNIDRDDLDDAARMLDKKIRFYAGQN